MILTVQPQLNWSYCLSNMLEFKPDYTVAQSAISRHQISPTRRYPPLFAGGTVSVCQDFVVIPP